MNKDVATLLKFLITKQAETEKLVALLLQMTEFQSLVINGLLPRCQSTDCEAPASLIYTPTKYRYCDRCAAIMIKDKSYVMSDFLEIENANAVRSVVEHHDMIKMLDHVPEHKPH